MRVKFYGHSDDCVELEVTDATGKVRRDERYAGPKGNNDIGALMSKPCRCPKEPTRG